jgi:hypothetical protein
MTRNNLSKVTSLYKVTSIYASAGGPKVTSIISHFSHFSHYKVTSIYASAGGHLSGSLKKA